MKLLLDTCTFPYLALEPNKLSPVARRLYADPMNVCYLSTISCWEVNVLFNLNRLTLIKPPDIFVSTQRVQHRIQLLTQSESAALYGNKLPKIHKDPFDRMLVCQAIIDDMTILTPDPLIQQYPVKTV